MVWWMPPSARPPSQDRRIGSLGGNQSFGAPDLAIARLADRQLGVVARRQLIALGITPKMVHIRLVAKRLRPLHAGVYAVGHACLTRRSEWLAGVLAAGPDAVLSHHSAAALHGLREERSRRVDVTTAANRRTTNWLEVHRRTVLTVDDVTVRHRIPVTTVSRTLVDLADLLGPRQLARVINEADVLGRLDLGAVDAVLERLRGRRGAGPRKIRAALASHYGPVVLRSDLEHRFKELLAAHSLPRPEHNVGIEGWEVDACWRGRRLVVELDSRFHDTPAAQRKDASKTRALRADGWEVVRYRWRDVVGQPARTADDLHDRLITR